MLISPDKNGVRPAVSDADMALFATICQRTQLDCFTRQIYLLPIKGRLCVHIGIDGLRALAARSGVPIGTQIYWKAKGGEWQDVWEGDGVPFAAMCVGTRGGVTTKKVVLYSEFPTLQDRKAHQLGVVCERHWLRSVAPFELAAASRQITSTGMALSVDEDEPAPLPRPPRLHYRPEQAIDVTPTIDEHTGEIVDAERPPTFTDAEVIALADTANDEHYTPSPEEQERVAALERWEAAWDACDKEGSKPKKPRDLGAEETTDAIGIMAASLEKWLSDRRAKRGQ